MSAARAGARARSVGLYVGSNAGCVAWRSRARSKALLHQVTCVFGVKYITKLTHRHATASLDT